MPLKYRYDKQTDIPSDQVGHYKEHNGSFILDVDGAVDKSRLDEFRASTLALTKERDDLRQRFDGIDPAEVRKLADEKRKLEEAQQLKAGEVDKVIETRIKSVRGDLEKQISNLTSERDALTSRLTAIQIDQGILTAATKRGIRPTAMPDILARARSVFRLINGALPGRALLPAHRPGRGCRGSLGETGAR
jgi:hypothetical protein